MLFMNLIVIQLKLFSNLFMHYGSKILYKNIKYLKISLKNNFCHSVNNEIDKDTRNTLIVKKN